MMLKNNLKKEDLLVDMKIQPAMVIGDSAHYLKRQKPHARIGFYAGRFSEITALDCVFLSLCKTRCDLLVVGVESDYSARLKNESSLTKQTDKERMFAVSTLVVVDYVVLFDDLDASTCMMQIRPDVVFSGLYNEEEERKFCPKTDNTEVVKHPFDLKSTDKKAIALKYFDLG